MKNNLSAVQGTAEINQYCSFLRYNKHRTERIALLYFISGFILVTKINHHLLSLGLFYVLVFTI